MTDRQAHKAACNKIRKAQIHLDDEEQELRKAPADFGLPANVFETSVGHFGGISATRYYMLARYALVESILELETQDAVQSALDHIFDMLRLCRSDNIGVRALVPALFLRLGKDQECYDFVRWYATTGQANDYDWGDMSLPYLDVKNADAFEPVNYICTSFPTLSHVLAITLLKIKLLLSLTALKNLPIALSAFKVPVEIVDNIKIHLPDSIIVTNDSDIMSQTDHTAQVEELTSQVEMLYDTVRKEDHRTWPTLLKSEMHSTTRSDYGCGSLAEIQLTWNESPAALQVIKNLRLGRMKDVHVSEHKQKKQRMLRMKDT